MAIETPVLLGSNGYGAPSAPTETTDPFVVTLSRVVTTGALVFASVVVVRPNGAVGTPVLSGGGITWTRHDQIDYRTTGSLTSTLFVFRGVAVAPSGTSVTVTPAEGYRVMVANVVEVEGAVVTGTNGSDGIIQSEPAVGMSVGMQTLASPDNAFLVFGAYTRSTDASRTFTPRTGFTELDERGQVDSANAIAALHIQYAIGLEDVDPTVSFTLSGATDAQGIIGLEIAAAGGDPDPEPIAGASPGTSDDTGTITARVQITGVSEGTSSDGAAASLRYAIMGTCSDSEGPLEGALLYLIDEATDEVIDTALSGEDGAYQFTDVAPGTYHISPSHSGGRAEAVSGVVIGGG